MLKLAFDMTMKNQLKNLAKSRLVLKCSKHSRYNPAHGKDPIIGNCPTCLAAFDAYTAYIGLRQAIAEYIEVTSPYETAKPRQKKPVTTSPKLDAALDTFLAI